MASNPYNQILLFGDSITQFSFDPETRGYGIQLANAYVRKLDIVNRGFSGYNTEWSLPILRQTLPTTEAQQKGDSSIQLMTIFFGANDAASPSTCQNVPLERFESNIKEMVDTVKNPASKFYNPNMRLILITPPPVHEKMWEKSCEEKGEKLNRFNESVRIYAECVVKIGKETNIPVVNLWKLFMDNVNGEQDGLSQYFTDGLHLNANGYKILYDNLMHVIFEKYNDIHPDNLPMDQIGWREKVEALNTA